MKKVTCQTRTNANENLLIKWEVSFALMRSITKFTYQINLIQRDEIDDDVDV